jgi:putative transposase
VTRRSGQFVLTLTCELPDFHPARRHDAEKRPFVGVDRGLVALAVVADAKREQFSCIESPGFLAASLPKLRRASRAVSRKVPGSANRKKAVRRLARVHAKIANRRADFAHKASSDLAKNHGAICLEELAISNLVKNRHLARSIADAAWGELGRQLAYKANWYGTELQVAPRFFPSTRRCSRCGWIDREMTLAKRTFRCSNCGLVVDRDVNAAANLAAYADAERSHPRTPKREAGSSMPAETAALAVTS